MKIIVTLCIAASMLQSCTTDHLPDPPSQGAGESPDTPEMPDTTGATNPQSSAGTMTPEITPWGNDGNDNGGTAQ